MKTTITVEVVTGSIEVYPEDGQSEEDFKTEEEKKELEDFRIGFTKDFHDSVVKKVKKIINEVDAYDLVNDENYIEGYDDLEDYKTTINIK